MASTIADHYSGRYTSSGQPYYPHGYTAAHNTLPFGTRVNVRNLHTGRMVTVTINDRFPYYPGRVINLSSSAARQIGIPYMRMAQVELAANSSYGGNSYGRSYSSPSYAAAPAPSYYQGYQSTPPAYYNPSYQQTPAQQPRYAAQPAPKKTTKKTTSAPVASRAPKKTYSAPVTQAPKRSYSAPPAGSGLGGGAPAYTGGNGPPPGLTTF